MRNKKLLGALLAVTTLATFGLAGCGDSGSNGSASKEDDKTITVAASPTPHAEILNKAVKSLVEKDGYKLEVKEFTDYVQPNTATEDGEVDANYFQHKPYLDNFNKEKGTHLVSVEGIHFEPFGYTLARPRICRICRMAPPWPCRTTPPTRPVRFCCCRMPV